MDRRTLLALVLMALVINAFDATPDGLHVWVRTRSPQTSDVAPHGVFEVADEGTGVARINQSKIFEPFFTTKARGHGTGLGLAISYGIISDHGGLLELVSTEPPGATFRVSLPLART